MSYLTTIKYLLIHVPSRKLSRAPRLNSCSTLQSGRGRGVTGGKPHLISKLDLKIPILEKNKKNFLLCPADSLPSFAALFAPFSPTRGNWRITYKNTIGDFHTICVLPPGMEPASFRYRRRILPSKVCSPPAGELA
jgi:hypothetical protein